MPTADSVPRTSEAAQDPRATPTHKSTRPAKSRSQLADRSATQPRLPGSEARRNVTPEELTFISAARDTRIGDFHTKTFFISLCSYARVLERTRIGRCRVSQARIAADLETTTRAVRRNIEKLKATGRVTVRRTGRSAVMELNAEPANLWQVAQQQVDTPGVHPVSTPGVVA